MSILHAPPPPYESLAGPYCAPAGGALPLPAPRHQPWLYYQPAILIIALWWGPVRVLDIELQTKRLISRQQQRCNAAAAQQILKLHAHATPSFPTSLLKSSILPASSWLSGQY